MLEFLPPRYFCDFTAPMREDGTPLNSTSQPGDYEIYVRWLSDYLHRVELPLSPDQQAWMAASPRTPDSIIPACSDGYGFAACDLEIVEAAIDDGESYGDFRSRMKVLWEEQNPTVGEQQEHPFEGWLGVPEAVFDRLTRERRQELQTGQVWSHADIPFRSLLSNALRQIPDAAERFKQMDFFFRNYSESASK